MNTLALATIDTFRNQIVHADACTLLRSLPPQSVNCCVTSPPYFNLRDYGAVGQIGQEDTPDQFIQALVDVFRLVWRVLRDDGTLWLNLGDTYAGGGRGEPGKTSQIQACRSGTQTMALNSYNTYDFKRKDLMGLPWRVALALQADGWYLRTDIIWHKTNAMPSSVTDRPTRDHEYIFLLTKAPHYYYDATAIREQSAPSSIARAQYSGGKPSPKQVQAVADGIYKGLPNATKNYGAGRNKRTVWGIATRPLRDGHFAAFPPALVEPCILAGCPPDGIVLDPFMGSGTTAIVAQQHRRDYIGCDLNPEYVQLARERVRYAGDDTCRRADQESGAQRLALFD